MEDSKPKKYKYTLSIEEKAWNDKRIERMKEKTGAGAGIGLASSCALAYYLPFPRVWHRSALVVSGMLIGSISGFLLAENESLNALERIPGKSKLKDEIELLATERLSGQQAAREAPSMTLSEVKSTLPFKKD